MIKTHAPNKSRRRFGPLTSCVLVGAVIGSIYGVMASVLTGDGVIFWWVDGTNCAVIGAILGLGVGFIMDFRCREQARVDPERRGKPLDLSAVKTDAPSDDGLQE